jgi:GNAT superfamily N-acetyltransferase
MWWRTTRNAWTAMGKAKRKAVFKDLVEGAAVPGILAYHGERPVGWCAVAPRRDTPGLDRSHVARPVDDAEVWSITCFYVAAPYRRDGMMSALVEAAVGGARIVEAYPHDRGDKVGAGDVFMGLASAFRRCGFDEVARRTPKRPVMRRQLR